jgi:hypothetical protein
MSPLPLMVLRSRIQLSLLRYVENENGKKVIINTHRMNSSLLDLKMGLYPSIVSSQTYWRKFLSDVNYLFEISHFRQMRLGLP